MTRFVSLRLMNHLKEEEGEKPQGRAGLVQGLSPRLDQCHSCPCSRSISESPNQRPLVETSLDFFRLIPSS